MNRKQGDHESVRSFGEAFRTLCQEGYTDCNSDQSLELLRTGLIPALGYDLALAARPWRRIHIRYSTGALDPAGEE